MSISLGTCHPTSLLLPSHSCRRCLVQYSQPRTQRARVSSVRAMAAGEREGLRKGIAEFYDESSGIWESVWGDHMHHGYYDPSSAAAASADLSGHGSAQIRMVEESLRFAGVTVAVTDQRKAAAEVEGLKKGIAALYDESSELWENLWGVHMHHGFYEPGVSTSAADHRLAQIRMVEEALAFAGITDEKKPEKIVDVGCGIGGSSRYLAKKFGANCCGITLSPVQAERAQALAAAEGLADRVSFQVADALEQPFPDGQFDLVWSMESGEHMPDKRKFVSELARVAAPGSTIIIVTWCHRDLKPSEDSLKPDELNLLKKICSAYYLPAWCSASDYVKIAESLLLQDIKTADWSENVAPFWPAVIRSALTWRGFTSLLRSGWKTIRGALVMPLMIEGYKKDLIKFAIISCRKPE